MNRGIDKKYFVFGILILFVGTTLPSCITAETHQIDVTKEGKEYALNGRPQALSKLPPKEEWNKTYGGEKDEFAYEVQQTTDGGFIIGGWTKSFGIAKWNPWVIKTDSNGTEEWNRTYTYYGLANKSGFVQSVQQTNDHGYILGCTFFTSAKDKPVGRGFSREFISSLVLIKTDVAGAELWNRTYTGLEYSTCFYVRQTSDNGYIATGGGNSSSYLPTNLFLLKTAADGTMQWLRSYGTSDMYEEGHAVQQTSDGGYIVTGISDLNYDTNWGEIWLIKTDSNGLISWSKKFQGSLETGSYGNSVQETSDHGYVIAGMLNVQGCLLKTDASGTELWRKNPFLNDYRLFYYSGKQTTDGGYIATGMGLVKTDAQGNEEWNKTMPQPFICDLQSSDGGYVMVGSTSGYYGGDIWLMKFATPQVAFTILGGRGVQEKITNTGAVDADGVAWQIHVEGGILHHINRTLNGSVNIPVGASEEVGTGSFFGLGGIQITATVTTETKTVQGIQVLVFTIVKS